MFILSVLAGCATTTQFSTSQTQSESRDAQITDLTIALEEERQEKQRLLKVIQEHEARIEELVLESQEAKTTGPVFAGHKGYYFYVIAIQSALKNAGFSPGFIDGRMGRRTQAALKDFQKANGLSTDGRIDRQTWNLLRNYL